MVLGALADVGPFQGLKDLIALDLLGSIWDCDEFERVSSLQALEAFGVWFLWVHLKAFGILDTRRDLQPYVCSEPIGICSHSGESSKRKHVKKRTESTDLPILPTQHLVWTVTEQESDRSFILSEQLPLFPNLTSIFSIEINMHLAPVLTRDCQSR